MKAEKASDSVEAIAFYHEKGLVPSFKQATQFAGANGRVATAIDIVDARITTEPGQVPWETYFTTLTAEYMGVSRGGTKILIVAHGIGPMSTLDGILQAYKYEYGKKGRAKNRRGGRISQQEFIKLEKGDYGKVSIVDLDALNQRYQYPFLEVLTWDQIREEPLLQARLGLNWHQYVRKHGEAAIKWHRSKGHGLVPNPYIIQMGDAANCAYLNRTPENGLAFAHLISLGGLTNLSHYGERKSSLVCDISCHEWWNGVRFVGIRGKDKIPDIHQGMDSVSRAIHQSWQKLMRPIKGSTSAKGFFALMQLEDDSWFTQYLKQGDGMDTWEPEFRVMSIHPVGAPVNFKTKIDGYHGFFKYGIQEVRTTAPEKTNAYKTVGEPQIVWKDGDPTHHEIKIQFYRVEIDTTKRLIKAEQVRDDFDLMMKLILLNSE